MKTPNRPSRRGEEGIALIYVAVFLLVSLWFVSLAVDAGKLMAARTELQAAADAAALAAASAIDPETGEINVDLARARAAETSSLNRAMHDIKRPVVIDPANDVTFPTPQQVQVTVRRDNTNGMPVLLHFAQTLGLPSLGVRADAIAEAAVLNNVCQGLAPFAPSQLPNGVPFSTSCDSSYVLKVGAQGNQQGNFQLLHYPDCPEDEFDGGGGANAVEYYIRNGYKCCAGIGDELVETEPGNKVGPVRDALIWRFRQDTDQQSTCYQNYHGNGMRIFLTPVIESFDLNGRKMAKIKGFAAFFMKEEPHGSMSQHGVPGQFIRYVAPGEIGDAPPESTGVYGLHLIE
jgi:hypothetical protein